LNLIGHDRQPGSLLDRVLSQLFGVVGARLPLQDESLVADLKPQVLDSTGQTAPHLSFELRDFVRERVAQGLYLFL
jgi:hypothetical protein